MAITLLDIAKANGCDAVVGLIEEATKVHPEITLLPARTIKGLNYKTLVRTAVPSVTFRNANEGVAATKSTFENRLVETYTLNPQWEADKAVADRYEDGAAAYLAMEGVGHMEGAMQQLAKVFFYGTNATFGDAKGFPGLLEMYDATNMVVDAAGTSDNTCSSVWAVRFGPQNVQWVWGQDGSLDLSEVSTVRLLDGSLNPYTGYRQELLAYPGLQVGSLYSVARIKKITAETNKTLTDAMLANLLEKFPAGITPDVFFMSRRSRGQLRGNRTATNATGTPAPLPEEAFGIPIAVTDALSNIETLTL
jgi:hypothetical protein